ncbi:MULTISPECIES: antitoxin VbhA family protein [Nocardia]|uniref:antitoxin VbhA family protein n=1 Tax=Nocardia TaxID=1817 RepID=UPI000D687C66|nr:MULTISPECIES: antitoxin VbhA family protein [Nocardia]
MAGRRPVDERARRARVIRAVRTTSELEGARSTDATRADQDAYVRGEIDIEQLGARVRARYKLA